MIFSRRSIFISIGNKNDLGLNEIRIIDKKKLNNIKDRIITCYFYHVKNMKNIYTGLKLLNNV